jgi:hypothetical protein
MWSSGYASHSRRRHAGPKRQSAPHSSRAAAYTGQLLQIRHLAVQAADLQQVGTTRSEAAEKIVSPARPEGTGGSASVRATDTSTYVCM